VKPEAVKDDTIAAVSTPAGEGGIGIVRMSGPESLAVADRIFAPARPDGPRPSECAAYTTHYGHIIDSARAAKIDEVLLTVMRAPKSYTREDVVEINCHGGPQAMRRVFELALKAGCRVAEPGEFTKRAFLNGRIDLAQAEAVADVIRAKTEASLKAAMGQLEGALSGRVDAMLDDIVDITSHVEASIDFPDEGPETAGSAELLAKSEAVIAGIKSLADTFGAGIVLREGVLATICGKPNVGKSSLMNLLLKRDRVIVSPVPGTTRDAVEETVNLGGIPVRLADTAGIADAADALERESSSRSRKYLGLADIVIFVVDCSAPLDADDMAVMALVGNKKRVVVLNKSDLAARGAADGARAAFPDDTVVEVSVKERTNIEGLEKAIEDTVWSGGYSSGEGAIVSNARHKELLDKALRNMLSVKEALGRQAAQPELAAVDLREAAYHLGLITGRSVSGDVLDRIFERFCIGK
jgi:tRNA modification GTPase